MARPKKKKKSFNDLKNISVSVVRSLCRDTSNSLSVAVETVYLTNYSYVSLTACLVKCLPIVIFICQIIHKC